MHKIISKKLQYWNEAIEGCSTRKDNPTAVLQAIADDMKQWVEILNTCEDLAETAEDGDQIVIYTREKNSGIIH